MLLDIQLVIISVIKPLGGLKHNHNGATMNSV